MSIEIRQVADQEVPRFDAAMQLGFGADAVPAGADRLRSIMPLDRMLGAFDGDEIVGTFGLSSGGLHRSRSRNMAGQGG